MLLYLSKIFKSESKNELLNCLTEIVDSHYTKEKEVKIMHANSLSLSIENYLNNVIPQPDCQHPYPVTMTDNFARALHHVKT